jgi:phage I-like protein
MEEHMLTQTIESVPRFVATLAAPLAPQDELVRVPLAVTGRWARGTREFAITREDLAAIVRNFQGRQNGEINVDYDHASEMPEVAAGGPIPSAGRIIKLDPPEEFQDSAAGTQAPSPERRAILYGWYEPTDRARRLIANREYRYISPAIDWAARSKRNGKPQGATLSTVALTNRPFLEEMPPIRLSDPEFRLVEDSRTLEAQPADRTHAGGLMKTVHLSVADGKVKITHEGQEFFADPADVAACAAALASEVSPPPSEANSEAEEIPLSRARSFLSEADAADKSVSALELFRGEVDRALDEAVRTGKILPRRRDDWRKIALHDFPAFRRLVADQKPLIPLRPVGLSGTAPEGAQMQVKLLAEQRMRERGISFGQALSDISREQPELAREYRRAVSSSE